MKLALAELKKKSSELGLAAALGGCGRGLALFAIGFAAATAVLR